MRLAAIVLVIVGILTALTGLLWIGQGTGVFPYPASSFMINQSPWILRGVITTIVGVAIIWAARRFLR
ncbi:hypothetical protein ACRQ1B_23500 [Rhizobium panacihumi]|uniref:hypothetical protein n=1 Tax=Rhizobium panacihumi TaxID=2008450 RepID=UPI003D794822